MSTILVFTENVGGQLKRSSLELLQAAEKSGNKKVVAVALGTHASKVTNDLANNGATEVHIVADASLDIYNPEVYFSALDTVIAAVKPNVVLASATSIGKDIFPRLAAKIGAGVASDCTEVTLSGALKATKPMYSGKCFATVEFNTANTNFVLMRPNQLPVQAAAAGKTAAVVEHSVAKTDLMTLIKDVVKGASEKMDLTEANIIVSGGRGLKDPANFKILADLADVLGATVGASRAVVDAGWVSHDMQVGQTGKTVAPTLYIAVGISGAIQHLAGMSGSKVIVAVNSDANAPIFQKATYGIVGDALEVVPKLTEEFKKLLQ